jgi:hypothetical protein
MKLVVFLLAAYLWLSTVVTVALPAHERGDIAEGGNFVMSEDGPMAEDFNATSLAPSKCDFMSGKYVFDNRIGWCTTSHPRTPTL